MEDYRFCGSRNGVEITVIIKSQRHIHKEFKKVVANEEFENVPGALRYIGLEFVKWTKGLQ